jgi:hypothetical protein
MPSSARRPMGRIKRKGKQRSDFILFVDRLL